MKGIFGDLFDFNKDGELDSFERAMEFGLISELTADDDDDCDDFDIFDDDSDDW